MASTLFATSPIGFVLPQAAEGGKFLGVDWGSIALVAGVALVASVVVVGFYSLGLRLLSVGSSDDAAEDSGGTAGVAGARPLTATLAAYFCIAVGVAGVLYGLYLAIPQFHA
jgi:hypothetical protein